MKQPQYNPPDRFQMPKNPFRKAAGNGQKKIHPDQIKLDEVVRDRGLLRTVCAAFIPELTKYGRPCWDTFTRTPLFKAWTNGARSESIAILRLVFRGLLRSFYIKQTLAKSDGILRAVENMKSEAQLSVLAYAAAWTGWSELKRDAEEATGAEWRIDPPDPNEYGIDPSEDEELLAEIHAACNESRFLDIGPEHWALMFRDTVMMRRPSVDHDGEPTVDPEMEDARFEIRAGNLPEHRIVDAFGVVIEPEKTQTGGIIIP